MKIEIKIKPFTVPNFVIPIRKPGNRQDGFTPDSGIPISEMAEEDLSNMCDQFRHDVFMKAGKLDPSGSSND